MRPKKALLCSLVMASGIALSAPTAIAQNQPDVVVTADAAPAWDAAPVVDASPAVVDASVQPPAAEEPKAEGSTGLAKLVDQLLLIIIPAFLTLVGLLVTFILNWIRKKLKLNVSDQQISSWSLVAEKAASRGAEWARQKAKNSVDGKKVPGPEILDVAVDWAIDMGASLNLPAIGREKLIGLIEAHLFDSRGEDI